MDTISRFWVDIEGYRAEGMPLWRAKQLATNYHRKFYKCEVSLEAPGVIGRISRQANPDAEITANSCYHDANLTPEARAAFCELVELVIDYCYSLPNPKARNVGRKWLASIIRNAAAEHLLPEARQQWIISELGDAGKFQKDLVSLCGHKAGKKSRAGTPFRNQLKTFQLGLRDYLQSIENPENSAEEIIP